MKNKTSKVALQKEVGRLLKKQLKYFDKLKDDDLKSAKRNIYTKMYYRTECEIQLLKTSIKRLSK